MASVFISYSSQDRGIAARIARDLEDAGVRVWLDTFELLPGDSLLDKITRGIKSSDYLIVILSRDSARSKWVQTEMRVALSRSADAAAKRVIPVRVDDSEVPSDLSGFVWLDLREDYVAGIGRLIATVSEKPPSAVPGVSEIIDTDDVAAHIADEQKGFRGAGYWVTTILSVLTLLVTAGAAVPSFYTAFAHEPRVFYSTTLQEIEVPTELDNARLQELIAENHIPDSIVKVEVINHGDAVAKEVRAGIDVPGLIVSARTQPPADPAPVWVGIEHELDTEKNPGHLRYTFRELIQDHAISATVGYLALQSDAEPRVDVVFDGKPASLVADISVVPQWSVWTALELPIKVLGIGLATTLVIGLAVVAAANPISRDALLLIVKDLNPTLARLADLIVRAMR